MSPSRILKFLAFFLLLPGVTQGAGTSLQADQIEKINPYKTRETYFEGTSNQLDVYTIRGLKEGKTLMILGGIHGNEPGGYLAADKYVDINLEKGTLIVIPRANLPTIRVAKRGIHGDMNRKFPEPKGKKDADGPVIQVLKKLMSQSDVLLNLHDGSGFYSPKWKNKMRNPNRFGQSVIIDRSQWKTKSGKSLDLGKVASRVVDRVNEKVSNKNHRFHVMNTNTATGKSIHPGMKFSATFFALNEFEVPSFGVETSKSLKTNALKVRYQATVINEFMKEVGIEASLPIPSLEDPKMDYVLLNVDDLYTVVAGPKETLELPLGSKVRVLDVKTNTDRGVFFRIPKYGDFNKGGSFTLDRSMELQIRKDGFYLSKVKLDPAAPMHSEPSRRLSGKNHAPTLALQKGKGKGDKEILLLFHRNGKRQLASLGQTISLVKGDLLLLNSLTSPDSAQLTKAKVNLEGFVGNQKVNDGEDRGYPIRTEKDLLAKWAKRGPRGSMVFDAVIKKGKTEIGRVHFSFIPPHFHYAVLEGEEGPPRFLRVESGNQQKEPVSVQGDQLKISSVNIPDGDPGLIEIRLNGKKLESRSEGWEGALAKKERGQLEFFYGDRSLGSVWVQNQPSLTGK